MKAVIFTSTILTLLTFCEASAKPTGEAVSGFQCVENQYRRFATEPG